MSRMRRCGCNGPGNKINEIMNSATIVHFAYLLIVLDEGEHIL